MVTKISVSTGSILLIDDFTRADFSEQKNLKIALFETALVEVMLVGTPVHKHVHVFVIRDLCSIARFSSILLMDDFTKADFSEQKNLKIAQRLPR